MHKFHVMFHTDTNHATQSMVVAANNKADAKSIVRLVFSEQVHFLSVTRVD